MILPYAHLDRVREAARSASALCGRDIADDDLAVEPRAGCGELVGQVR